MIRFLTFLIFMSAAVMMSGKPSERVIDRHDSKGGMCKAGKTAMKADRLDNSRAESLRRPTVIKSYEWVDGAWDIENGIIIRQTYNEDGNPLVSIYPDYRKESSYDDLGRESGYRIFQTYDGEEYLSDDVEYRYDSIVTDFITADLEKNDESVSGYGTEIIRNEDDNVIKIRRYFEMDEEKSYDGEWISIEYGPDGKANVITKKFESPNEEGIFDTGISWQLTDIVWENTNGQILLEDMDLEYPLSKWYFGENRIKSAILTDYSWPDPILVTVEYDNESYHSRFVMNEDSVGEITYESLDDFGSYRYEQDMKMFSYDWEGNLIPYTTHDITTLITDRFGLTLEFEEEAVRRSGAEDEETEKSHYKGYVTYDSYGYPIEAIGTAYSLETGGFENTSLTVFSDYVDCSTSVNAIESAMYEEPEYYNLQGVKVDNPSNGIHIRGQGANFTKIAF